MDTALEKKPIIEDDNLADSRTGENSDEELLPAAPLAETPVLEAPADMEADHVRRADS